MTNILPGVLRRRQGEPRPERFRRRREPVGEFHVEAADEAMREADERKLIAIHCGARRR